VLQYVYAGRSASRGFVPEVLLIWVVRLSFGAAGQRWDGAVLCTMEEENGEM